MKGDEVSSELRCEAARARGRGFASEKAIFGATSFQLGTDPVGASCEMRSASPSTPHSSLLIPNLQPKASTKVSRCSIMAPAGGPDAFDAAIKAGADEIYMGVAGYGARQFAQNFSVEQYCSAIKTAHLYGAKINLTFNTLMTDSERESSFPWLNDLYEAGLDAAIVQDWGVADFLIENFPGLAIHASTQFSLTTPEECVFMAKNGFSRLVLARELTLEEIAAIRSALNESGLEKTELEVFASGALCLCCSGKCYMSSFLGGRSGNRGSCAQPCRLPYKIADSVNPKEPARPYLSLKDQWQEPDDLVRMIDAGVNVIKLEGRMKSPSYVFQAVSYYRRALDNLPGAVTNKPERTTDLEPEIARTFNRGYAKGYLYKSDPDILNTSFSANWGVPLGQVKSGRVVLEKPVRNGDGVAFLDAQLQKLGGTNISQIREYPGGAVVPESSAGKTVEFDVPVPPRTKFVWKTFDIQLQKNVQKLIDQTRRYVPVDAVIKAVVGEPLQLTLSDGKHSVTVESDALVEPSEKRSATEESLYKNLNRFGESPFCLNGFQCETDSKSFVPASVLYGLRQKAVELLALARQIGRPRRDNQSEWQTFPCPALVPPTSKPRFAACVRTEEQEQFCRQHGWTVYREQTPVRFPDVTTIQTESPLAGSLDEALRLERLNVPYAADWTINVTNPRSLKTLERLLPNMRVCYISPELFTGAVLPGGAEETQSAVRALASAASVELGVVVFGAPRLMYTRKTLFQEPVTELVNPDGRRLRVERNEIAGSSIYEIKEASCELRVARNRSPYSLLPIPYSLLPNLGITELRFDLSWHTITELEKWLNPLL